MFGLWARWGLNWEMAKRRYRTCMQQERCFRLREILRRHCTDLPTGRRDTMTFLKSTYSYYNTNGKVYLHMYICTDLLLFYLTAFRNTIYLLCYDIMIDENCRKQYYYSRENSAYVANCGIYIIKCYVIKNK